MTLPRLKLVTNSDQSISIELQDEADRTTASSSKEKGRLEVADFQESFHLADLVVLCRDKMLERQRLERRDRGYERGRGHLRMCLILSAIVAVYGFLLIIALLLGANAHDHDDAVAINPMLTGIAY